jgi:hypothetical protein
MLKNYSQYINEHKDTEKFIGGLEKKEKIKNLSKKSIKDLLQEIKNKINNDVDISEYIYSINIKLTPYDIKIKQNPTTTEVDEILKKVKESLKTIYIDDKLYFTIRNNKVVTTKKDLGIKNGDILIYDIEPESDKNFIVDKIIRNEKQLKHKGYNVSMFYPKIKKIT